jgi:hypothetical protein
MSNIYTSFMNPHFSLTIVYKILTKTPCICAENAVTKLLCWKDGESVIDQGHEQSTRKPIRQGGTDRLWLDATGSAGRRAPEESASLHVAAVGGVG